MGVLVKRPGDKVVLNPIKLWGSIAIGALFLSLVFRFVGGDSSEAQEGSKEEEEGAISKTFLPPDPNCPPIELGYLEEGKVVADDVESGLVTVCGRVVSAHVANITTDGKVAREKDDEDSVSGEEEEKEKIAHREVRRPLKGVTVAVYEHDPTSSTGKTVGGALTHLFSSTVTNDQGRYRLKMRGIGPGDFSAYVVVLCDERYAGGKRIDSRRTLSDLDFLVSCELGTDTKYEYKSPPQNLALVSRAQILECTTDVTDEPGTSTDSFNIPVKNAATTRITSEAKIVEENYDFRYVAPATIMEKLNILQANPEGLFGLVLRAIGGGIQNSLVGEGAYWAKDCEVKKQLGGHDDWICESGNTYCEDEGGCDATTDERYTREYLTSNTLQHIPERGQDLAWRRIDERLSFQQMNQFPFVIQQFLSSNFGNYSTNVPLIKQPTSISGVIRNEKEDPLVLCDDIEEGKLSTDLFDPEDEVPSLARTRSWGIGLASPGTWNELLGLGLVEEDMDLPYCDLGDNEGLLTFRQVLEDKELYEKYFRPEMVIPKGSGSVPWNSESSEDSVAQDYVARGEKFGAFSTEARLPHKDKSSSILPEGKNRSASTVAALYLTNDGGTGDTNLLGGIFSPKKKGAEPAEELVIDLGTVEDDPIKIWDLGGTVLGLCAVSNTERSLTGGSGEAGGLDLFESSISRRDYGVGEGIHNIFAGNSSHITDTSVGSATVYTEASYLRDQYLADDFVADAIDSLLALAAGGTRIDFSTLNIPLAIDVFIQAALWEGAQKSFGERENFDNTPGTDEAVGIHLYPRYVSYPLNAQNFGCYFPAIVPEVPGETCPLDIDLGRSYPGYHDHYPWDDLAVGEQCDVYPPRPSIRGLRTCKVNSCDRWQKRSVEVLFEMRPGESRLECNERCPSDCEYVGTFVPVGPVWDCPDEYEVTRYKRACTEAEERTACLARWPRTDTRVRGWYDVPEPPDGETRTRYTCDLSKAGPYTYIAPLEFKVDIELEQDVVPSDNVPATPIDSLVATTNQVRNAFKSPGAVVKEQKLAMIDWQQSKSDGENETMGIDVPGYGIATDGLTSIAASPTGSSHRTPHENVYFHCNLGNSAIIDSVAENEAGESAHWNCEVTPFVFGGCDPGLFAGIFSGVSGPIPDAEVAFNKSKRIEHFVKYPQLFEAYGFASANTGVPCEILAGLHFREGGNSILKSMHNGDGIDSNDLQHDVYSAAVKIRDDFGPIRSGGRLPITDWNFYDWVIALSNWQGGGNRNCLRDASAPPTPWGLARISGICANPDRASPYYGYDDPYVLQGMTNDQTGMYLRYCLDGLLCYDVPNKDGERMWPRFSGIGVIPFAIILNNHLLSQ